MCVCPSLPPPLHFPSSSSSSSSSSSLFTCKYSYAKKPVPPANQPSCKYIEPIPGKIDTAAYYSRLNWKLDLVNIPNQTLVLYILTSVWVLRTPKAGRTSHFQSFFCKKAKKARNLQQIFAKTCFFKFAPERWLTVLFPKKWAFFSKIMFLPMQSCKSLWSCVKRWSKYTTALLRKI